MKKSIKTILLILIPFAIIAILLYQSSKPRIIDEKYSIDNKYLISFIETKSPFLFESSEVKIELRTNDEEITEIQVINTNISNDGKMLYDTNWSVDFKKDYVEIILMGEEQANNIIKIYYIQQDYMPYK